MEYFLIVLIFTKVRSVDLYKSSQRHNELRKINLLNHFCFLIFSVKPFNQSYWDEARVEIYTKGDSIWLRLTEKSCLTHQALMRILTNITIVEIILIENSTSIGLRIESLRTGNLSQGQCTKQNMQTYFSLFWLYIKFYNHNHGI